VTAMDITIHASFLPHDDPDASLAFYRGEIAIRGDRAVDFRTSRSPFSQTIPTRPTTSGVTMTGSSTQGIKTVLHPVSDLATAKEVYAALLGVPPQTDESYYVGFEAAGQHIGLVPR